MKVYLEIDLGTSCVKTVFLTADGEIAALGSTDTKVSFPVSGYAEQDAAEWWTAAKQSVTSAFARCPEAEVCGVGISGQMLGSVLLDINKELIGDCIIWLDQRASEEVEEIKEIIGLEQILDITANYPLVSYWAPKLLWIKKNEPEKYQKISHVLFPKDYLKYKLTGVIDIDVTGAAMMAAVGAGEFADLKEAAEYIIKIKTVTYPNEENVKCYDDYYKVYTSLYKPLEKLWSNQAENVRHWGEGNE